MTYRYVAKDVIRRKRMQSERLNAAWDEPHRHGSGDVLWKSRRKAAEIDQGRKNTPYVGVVSKALVSVFGGRDRELEHVQVDPSSQEFRDSREEVHVVHPIPKKA